ncbi:MAG: stage V sporulation protein AD [Firmicutes bacterium]|nr:stage V sporulation protein AD [Bacillota bacterium]
MQDTSKRTLFFGNRPKIIGCSAVVGAREKEGPLGKFFRNVETDKTLGQKTFENAEIKMLEKAVESATRGAKLRFSEIDLLLSGDLMNQITSSSYVARKMAVPYMGLYSACSTMTQCLTLGASLVNAGYFDNIACATGSHFATAERQFRFPLEYGCQRPPYAQWTVTGAGCSIIGKDGDGPSITAATIGKAIDFGIKDLSNMGAAMAPAAMDTLCTLFKDTGTDASDYDMIVTGDLGKLGSDIFRDLMSGEGYYMGQDYSDCGAIIYDRNQRCYQGGSGAGCSAAVFNSFVMERLWKKTINKVVFLATGALMSNTSSYQGESIPAISHAVVVEN